MNEAGRWAWIACLAIAPGHVVEAAEKLRITPAGPQAILYDWSEDRCTDMHIPDSPLRAFRGPTGELTVLATHRENWALRGADWATLRPDCKTILSSRAQTDATLGNLWIASTYTVDGQTITAVISEDQTEDEIAAGCIRKGPPGQCWVNRLLLAQSVDVGSSFALVPEEQRVLATLRADYPASMQGRLGVFTASNIVRQGGYFVMLAFAEEKGLQPRGNCLFRTDTLADGRQWRVFDGEGFSATMRDASEPMPCTPLANLPNEVRSLSYDPARKLWIAVYASRQPQDDGRPAVPGFYFSQSADLVTWSRPRLIMPAPTRPREQQNDYFVAYPVLIDPASRSRNFETIDSGNAWLVFTVQHLKKGQGSLDRDLVYVPVMLE